MRVLIWHVHGSWMTSFVQGRHETIVPLDAARGPDGRGRARTWDWPQRVREVCTDRLATEPFDVVVLQRPHELELCERWTGLVPGRDVPALYVEHNTPTGHAATTRHPLADQSAIPIVHVTQFNRLMWDCGRAATELVEHGVPDPGYRYTGERDSLAVVVNEPVRRGRIVGTDILLRLACTEPIDVYGMGMTQLATAAATAGVHSLHGRLHDDVPQTELFSQLPQHRAYLHPYRWTSLGLSLIEAMLLGMPVLAVGTTEAVSAIPSGAGRVSCDPGALRRQAERWRADPEAARSAGLVAREYALRHHDLARFLSDWDHLLKGAASCAST